MSMRWTVIGSARATSSIVTSTVLPGAATGREAVARAYSPLAATISSPTARRASRTRGSSRRCSSSALARSSAGTACSG